ncbi:hypothetical protein ACQEVB_17465 [Pseudonocardia sp. CA-107938]|uniref:hypothetical protein n=1 Tax=Pseudonocardia sp. CA-107938 TaxID=3240021 RepID=UPI003D89CA59
MNDGQAAPADLAGRIAAQSAIAAALIDLEGHPAHTLLTAPGLTGTTERRWSVGKAQLAALWDDFARYQTVVAAAGDTADPAERQRLLTGPSVEVGRTVVADRITGREEQVERITLDELTARMDRSFGEVRDLLRAVHEQHQAHVARTTPLAESLSSARRIAATLDAEAETIRARALSTRLHELGEAAAHDPLGTTEAAALARLDAIAAEVEQLADRLTTAARLRGGWAAELAEATRAVTAVDELRGRAAAARARAVEIVVGPVAELPEDHGRELHSRLAALDRGSWTTRATAMAELQAAIAAATAELTTAHQLATGLIDRRAELRGRYEAYRAKSVRLGRAEEPEVLRLADEVRELLWTRPCDLAAATRALAAYQRALNQAGTAATTPEEIT